MGLRIMQSRAGMMGGTLAIERNAGGGASVTVSAPNGPPPKNEAPPWPQKINHPPNGCSSWTTIR